MEKEDVRLIEMLAAEISKCGKELSFEKLDRQFNGKLSKEHIGISSLNVMDTLRPELRYVYVSEEKLAAAMREFFSNRYNVKHIARNAYVLDEGDKFVECMDMSENVGIISKEDEIIRTSLLEVKMKVLPWGTRNKATGFPFEIMSIRPIKSDWDNPKGVEVAKEIEIDFSSYQQMTIYNFLRAEASAK